MGELREKMVRRMELRNFSRKTIKTYLYHMKKYVGYYMKSPDELGKEEIEKYLHYLLQTKVSSSTMVQAYSSFKFFYSECLERTWELEKIPRPKIEKRLPVVLSPEEIRKILQNVNNIKYKTVLMIIYSAGLRLSEALKLKLKDIDSKRMQIRVEQGKGKKDRYTLLSDVMIKKLRKYCIIIKPLYSEDHQSDYLFPGKNGNPICSSTIQRTFTRAKKKPELKKTQQYIHYATASQHIC